MTPEEMGLEVKDLWEIAKLNEIVTKLEKNRSGPERLSDSEDENKKQTPVPPEKRRGNNGYLWF